MNQSESAIEISNLSITLGDDFKALKNIDATLSQGRIVGFIGPSGAGKTTLMRCIVGRQRITKGEVKIFGLPAGSAKLRPLLTYMTQELSVYSDLTVYENLRYFATMFGAGHRNTKASINHILDTVDMSDKAGSLVEDLSGGQKQRVSLAISLIGAPKLMILDEPTVGLDPLLREQIWKLFRKLSAEGTTLIISSHVMEEAERCDDLLLLRDGKLLAHDSPQNLCSQTNSKTVEQSFLKLVGDER